MFTFGKEIIQIRIKKLEFRFRRPAGTSRGMLLHRKSWFILLTKKGNPGIAGIGECAPLNGLSPETDSALEEKLQHLVHNPNDFIEGNPDIFKGFPSLKFGMETALKDIETGGKQILFPSLFTSGKDNISINGLIWMGDPGFMKKQIDEKLKNGYQCLKIKIGSLDFSKELELINYIRKKHPPDKIEIRVDANGAFSPSEASEKLKKLADLRVHSIEQPIMAGQWQEMARLCENPPVPVALDEEIIPLTEKEKRILLLETVRPQYLILKPGLLGGFSSCEEWKELAGKYNTGWWVTSALESNIGLNAIAQWTYSPGNIMPQGLGTGQLFADNFESPLYIRNAKLCFDCRKQWDFKRFQT